MGQLTIDRRPTFLEACFSARAREVVAIETALRALQVRLRALDACIHTSEFHNIGSAHGEIEMACDDLSREGRRCKEEAREA